MIEAAGGGDSLGEPAGAGNLPADDVAHLGAEVAAALADLHAAGAAYGDLHPGNIVLDAAGSASLARLPDTGPVATEGSAYRAPEVTAGGPSAAGDLYALGVVLYELAAGTLPPRREPPLRPAGLSEDRWAVIRALLASDPNTRPTAQATAAMLAGRAVPAEPVSPVEPVSPLVPRSVDEPPTMDDLGLHPRPGALPQSARPADPSLAASPLPRARRRRVRSGALAAVAVVGLAAAAWSLVGGDDSNPTADGMTVGARSVESPAPAGGRATPSNGPIAYVSRQADVWRLYRMNPDGTDQAPLTDLGSDTSPPVFSPDGTKIAFVGSGPGEDGLYLMNADGTGRIRLHESGRWPAFSPDGRTIVFDAMWHRNDEVHSIGVDGTGLRRLTDGGRADTPRTPMFSPGGGTVLCTGYVGADQVVLLMNADGTNRRQLVARGALPAFSPDGTTVAFTGTVDNEVYVIGVNGGDPTRLTHNAARDWFPRFSPDGRHIVFTSNRAGDGPDSEDFGLYAMNADGTDQTRLLPESLGRSVPTFSPDGTKIAVSALRGDPAAGEFDLYVLNADGTDATPLSVRGANPAWGPAAS